MTFKTFSLIIFSALIAVWPANGTVYTVSPNGSDKGLGTSAQPFKTIVHSVAKLRAGDVLEVVSGTYFESLPKSIPTGASWSSSVTIRGSGPTRPIFRPPVGSERVAIFDGGKAYVILDGLVLDARNASYECVKITGNSHHIRIQNCEITGAPNHGVLITGQNSVENEFINNDIHHNGSDDFDHGLYVVSAKNLIERCLIHHNAGWGVHIYGGVPHNNSNTVRANKIFSNGQKGRGPGVGVYSGTGHMVYNNVIWGNGGGVYLDYGTMGVAVLNNTITENRGFGVRVGEAASTNLIQNNISFHNTSAGVFVAGGSKKTTVRNNLISYNGPVNFQDISGKSITLNNLNGDTPANDPRFTNAPAGDFRLLENSPARNLGFPYPGVTNDIDGAIRSNATNCSAGACEFQSSLGGPQIPVSQVEGTLFVSGEMQMLWDDVNQVTYAMSQVLDSGAAAFEFDVPYLGSYYVWCLALAPKATSDSFWVSADGGEEDVFDIAQQSWSLSWQWVLLNGRGGKLPLSLNPRVMNFTAGSHILKFRAREPRAQISRVVLATDPQFNPAQGDPKAFSEPVPETGYRLQSSATLEDGEWCTLGPIRPNEAGKFDFDLSIEPEIPMRFYRVIELN